MRKITINQVIKKGRRIEIDYSQVGLEEFINPAVRPYHEYGCDIESVPDSIAVIPFLANMLPLCFALDAEIELDSIDEAFYNCIGPYREGYQKMIPMIPFGGKVIAKRIERNEYTPEKNCLLFSGGIDATNSLAVNADQIDDCITVWGADIRDNNEEGWEAMSQTVEDTVTKFKKNWMVVRANFRACINEGGATKVIAKTGEDWWLAMQSGIALLSQTAPLAYLNRYKTIFIASSYTKDFNPIDASDPRTDNCFRCASASAKHDGYEFDRFQKVLNIEKKRQELGVSLCLHVCWQSPSGRNCGHCEKCLRSYLNCRCVGVDPSNLGFVPSLTMKEIRRFYAHKVWFNPYLLYFFKQFQFYLSKLDKRDVPSDLKWILRFHPEKANSSPYWLLKRAYRKARNAFKR